MDIKPYDPLDSMLELDLDDDEVECAVSSESEGDMQN